MRNRSFICFGLALVATLAVPAVIAAAPEPSWLREPAVSPDGTRIAFTYGGQIWQVAASGGEAVPMTSGEFYCTRPVWSPDGRCLSFACKLHGNLDVFTMPADGGEIHRLTFDSSDDKPYAFSPDGKLVYFAAPRLGDVNSVHTGTYANSDQLYTVPAEGGRSRLLVTTPALEVSVSPDGGRLLYENRPIYENDWRKGAQSDGTHDVWLYDIKANTHRKLTTFRGEDRDPCWAPGGGYYYLSEQSGTFNIWQGTEGSDPRQVTRHSVSPVRFLSVANDGTLVYGWDGQIWRKPADGSDPKSVPVQIRQTSLVHGSFPADAGGYLTEITPSADSKQVALVARGEVYVLSTETGRSRRITSTPAYEQAVNFSPDGRSLAYVSERDGDMDLFVASLGEKDMTSFASPGLITEKKLVDSDGDLLYPRFSPDGKRLAYLANRSSIKVLDLATGTTVDALPEGSIYSYADGDVTFSWSPDSRWLTATAGSIVSQQDIVLLDVFGKRPPAYISQSGYADSDPRFSADGKAILWTSGREGLRRADATTGQLDIFIAYLTQQAYDASRAPEAASTTGPAATRPGDGDWQPQIDGIEHRTRRLTPFSITPAFFATTPDNKSLVFVDVQSNGQAVCYRVDLRSGARTQVFTRPVATDLTADKAVNSLYAPCPGGIEKIDLANGNSRTFPVTLPIELDPRGEMAYWFQYFWRMTALKFYEPGLHGVNWKQVRERYAKFLPHIHTWEDFAEMMSEMAGELNASHMGCFWLKQEPLSDQTASLGLHYDDSYSGAGMKVAAVIPGGPADLAGSHIAPGALILAVNGEPIDEKTPIEQFLNRTEGQPLALTVQPKDGGATVKETVVPVSSATALALTYQCWVDERKAMTKKLSGGRLGYIHIPEMEEGAYKRAYSEVIGDCRDKEGLIIDIRFNRGGNLHDQLITLFTGDVYAGFTNRQGELIGRMPSGRWAKPSTLIQNAGAYSDGSIFPHLYQNQKIGPIVGTRVPGTGTAVWWMYVMNGHLKWGIPEIGAKDFKTGWFENQEIVPDILIDNDPESIAAGRDPQLEAAVKNLLQQLDRAKLPSPPSNPQDSRK